MQDEQDCIDVCVGRAAVLREGCSAVFTCKLIWRSCAFGADASVSIRRTRFNSPARPADASVWPMLALQVPTVTGCEVSEQCLSTADTSDPISIGSPSAVPVPCASCPDVSLAVVPAQARATVSRSACADPLGAVKLADRPSDLTALPDEVCRAAASWRVTANTASPRA